jgi:hypothetical protein
MLMHQLDIIIGSPEAKTRTNMSWCGAYPAEDIWTQNLKQGNITVHVTGLEKKNSVHEYINRHM